MYKIVNDIWFLNHGRAYCHVQFEEYYEDLQAAVKRLKHHRKFENDDSTVIVDNTNGFIAIHMYCCAEKLEDYISYVARCAIEHYEKEDEKCTKS